jgi:DNA polymerase III subunit epsilon
MRFGCGIEHHGAHKAEADVVASLLVLDGQGERYDDLPRSVLELHRHTDYPKFVVPDRKFVRREDGAIVFAFSDHSGKTVEDAARDDPGSLEWMLRKDFSEEAKAVVRQSLTLGDGSNGAETTPHDFAQAARNPVLRTVSSGREGEAGT